VYTEVYVISLVQWMDRMYKESTAQADSSFTSVLTESSAVSTAAEAKRFLHPEVSVLRV
jgi:hypothetical protein